VIRGAGLKVVPVLAIAFHFAMVVALAGAAPATAPTTQPNLRTWFDQLADPDPEVRDGARLNLMGISRQQLEALERVVRESQPVRPSQAAELHDIVTHVYIAGEPYAPDSSGFAFLGVRWAQNPQDSISTDPPGLVVAGRVKGFPAYQAVRDGDVLVGIKEAPALPVTNALEFGNELRKLHPGTRVTLRVWRNGQLLDRPIKLAARPAWAEPGRTLDAQKEREERAEDYWQESFGKLLGESVSSARP
jgi:hypothetical protein